MESNNDKDLKVAIGWNKYNLNLLGIWPDPSSSGQTSGLLSYRFLLFTFFMAAFILLPQFTNLFFVWRNLGLLCETLSTAALPVLNAVIKLNLIRRHRQALRTLLQSFYDDWNNNPVEHERSIMLNGAYKAKKISIWCTILTQTMVSLYILMRTIEVTRTDRNVPDQFDLLLYRGYVPFDVRTTAILVFTNVGQVAAAYSATVSYTGVDSFVCMLFIHLCTQFSILQLRLQDLFRDQDHKSVVQTFRRELGRIVQRHEHLMWCGNALEESFNFFLLFQMLFCTIQICIQNFYFISLLKSGQLDVISTLFFLSFVSFIVAHIYLYCYVGEQILIQSAAMSISAYNSEWYNSQAAEARTLLFIMCRSIIPIRLTAGKFGTFSMEMFSTILRTAMGYLSMLLTVSSAGE